MVRIISKSLVLLAFTVVLCCGIYPLAVWAVAQAVFPFQANGKALGLGETVGWVKLISDKKYGEILGAHLIGPDVTELLPELTLAQMWELTPNEIARNVHSHPTLTETLKEVAHGVEGHMLNM